MIRSHSGHIAARYQDLENKVDKDVGNIREQLKVLTEKVDSNTSNIQRHLNELIFLTLNEVMILRADCRDNSLPRHCVG